MARIFLKTSLKTQEEIVPIFYEGYGILEDFKIVYKEQDVMTVIQKLGHRISFLRRHKDYEISLCFDNKQKTKGSYHIFSLRQLLNLEVETKQVLWNDQEVEIQYRLKMNEVDMGDYHYHLNYEVEK